MYNNWIRTGYKERIRLDSNKICLKIFLKKMHIMDNSSSNLSQISTNNSIKIKINVIKVMAL